MKNSFVLLMLLCFLGCKDEVLTPKPHQYPKINLPEKSYQTFSDSDCNLSFEYPIYANVEKDQSFFDEAPKNPCWFDIKIPSLNGSLHCSYYPIKDRANFDKLVSDAFEMVSKHRIKANYRDENVITKPNGVSGLLFTLEGPVASPMQFFLTDSTKHFFRASLYFNSKVNPDSMKVVHDFVREDVLKMIESFEWR